MEIFNLHHDTAMMPCFRRKSRTVPRTANRGNHTQCDSAEVTESSGSISRGSTSKRRRSALIAKVKGRAAPNGIVPSLVQVPPGVSVEADPVTQMGALAWRIANDDDLRTMLITSSAMDI
jgi:hypothetical protein